MEEFLNEYYADNARKLRGVVDKILAKFGGLTGKDYDDFYSVANEVFVDVMRRYDGAQSFDGFLYSCLSNKMKSEFTARNRIKRMSDKNSISLDAPAGEGEFTVGDFIQSDFDIENEVSKKTRNLYEENIEEYLDSLSEIQRQIVEMRIEEMPVGEIKDRLELTDKQYSSQWEQIKAFRKTQILFKNSRKAVMIRGEKEMSAMMAQTLEKSKPDRLNIASVIKKIDNYTIRFDHPLQRESEQWSPVMKGNLISDILQGNPIPPLVFAEQVINGIAIIWDLDGKQRCTNVYSFAKNAYKISKNIRRWNVKYQSNVKDESGKIMRNENGIPEIEWKEFDIRGKRYSDLPEELQDKFKEYNFEITQYLNCSGDDIAYHIARYNEGKSMTVSQKGLTRLGEEFALLVKSISNMPFFRDKGGYKVSEFRNGTINRVVVESIMASDFLYDWKKQQEEMCDYIRENATGANFDNFEEMIERLTLVTSEEVAEMFNSKDSFLWFALFARFAKYDLEDRRFIEFMEEFGRSLHEKEVNGETFDSLNSRSTKDKNIVILKMSHLEHLMCQYLDIKKESDGKPIVVRNKALRKYIEEFCRSGLLKTAHVSSKREKEKTAVQSLMMICGEDEISDKEIRVFVERKDPDGNDLEGTLLYMDALNDWSLEIGGNSKKFVRENIPVLLKVVKYTFEKDLDRIASVWLKQYAEKFQIRDSENVPKTEIYRNMVADLAVFAGANEDSIN